MWKGEENGCANTKPDNRDYPVVPKTIHSMLCSFCPFFYPAIIDVMTQRFIGNFDAKIFYVLKQHVMILFKSKILKNE